jgi:hypothetical protein
VDVVFANTVGPDHTPPTVTSTSPVNNAQGVSINVAVTAFFSEALNSSTVNDTTFRLTKATGVKLWRQRLVTMQQLQDHSYANLAAPVFNRLYGNDQRWYEWQAY